MSDDFHVLLRRRRQQLGLTLSDVSYSSGLSAEEVVEIEAGCREANLQDLRCLAVPLRTNLFALLEQQVESEWKKLGPEWQAWGQELKGQIWPRPLERESDPELSEADKRIWEYWQCRHKVRELFFHRGLAVLTAW